MNLPNQQRGMTAIGWLFVIAMIVLVMMTVIKLAPAYISQFNVASVLSSMKDEPGIGTMTAGEMTSMLMKRLDINMVQDVQAGDIYITQQANNRIIEIDYQVQRNLLGNVDVLIKFNNRIEVPIR